MFRSLRILVAQLGIALLLPAVVAAQEPPPDEIAPPPAPTTTTISAEPVAPPGPTSTTIILPPLPAVKLAPKKATSQPAKPAEPEPAPVRRTTPRRSAPVASDDFEAPAAETSPAAETPPAKKATPKAKPKRKPAAKQKVQPPRPRPVAKAATPRTIPDREAAGAVLAAQFTLGREDAGGGGMSSGLVVLALVFAGLIVAVVGVLGAAPILADHWPKVFVPVIEATDRVLLAGLCLAGAAAALVITWALTGPGA